MRTLCNRYCTSFSFTVCVAYEYVHVQISPMLFCVDVLITQYFLKQSAYINRGLFLGRCCDVSSYK